MTFTEADAERIRAILEHPDLRPGALNWVDKNSPEFLTPTVHDELAGPYIRWTCYGYDGWQPSSYPTLEAALTAERNGQKIIVTKRVEYEVVERGG